MRSRGRRSSERRTAYHEAGHAVARYRLRGTRSAGVGAAEAAGRSEHRPPYARPPLLLRLPEVLSRIQVCLGGSVAERRGVGRADPRAADADRARARELALRVSFDPETELLLRWMAARTEHLIEFYWPDVETVARALLKRGSLTARELGELLGPAPGRQRRPQGRQS